jgi:hypothetical protein
MKAIKVRSKTNGMFSWAIKYDNGKLHGIDNDYQGYLRCLDIPELSYPVINGLIRNARARENRKAKEEAYKSCGLTKVRGSFGGVYWE